MGANIIKMTKLNIFIILLFLFIMSLAAQESVPQDSQDNQNDMEVETYDITDRVTDKSETKGIEARKKREQAKKEKAAKRASHLKITEVVAGVGNFTQLNLDKIVGNIKLQTRARTGGVQLYILNEKKRAIPLFNQQNNATTTGFWFRIGNKVTKLTNVQSPGVKSRAKEYIYKLTNNSKITTSCRDIPRGVAVAYVLPKKARLVVFYEAVDKTKEAIFLTNKSATTPPVAPAENSENNIIDKNTIIDSVNYPTLIGNNVIKVTATMENRGTITNIFSLKYVIDTYLGDGEQSHFSTNNNKYIISESYFDNFNWNSLKSAAAQDATLWIETKSNKISAKFATAGRGISPLERVVAASVDNLTQEGIWQNNIRVGRDFDSFDNYENSGLGIFWSKVRLGPKEKVTYTFYVVPSVIDYFENGDFFAALTEEIKVPEPPPKPEEPKVDIDLSLSTDGNRGKFIIDESDITDDKLNYDYVQTLIDRINEIENSGDSNELTENELLRLNTEIDIILEKLNK